MGIFDQIDSDGDASESLQVIDHEEYGAIAVAIVEGEAFAFQDQCTHQQCSLSEGILEEHGLICPCHQSMFDVRTGEVLMGPASIPLQTYSCSLDGDSVTIGQPL